MSDTKNPAWPTPGGPLVASRPSWGAPRRHSLRPLFGGSSRPAPGWSEPPRSTRLPALAHPPRITERAEEPPVVLALPSAPVDTHDPGDLADLASLRAELAATAQSLAKVSAELASLRGDVARSAEPELVKLARLIAERVVGRELRSDPALIAKWARAGIERLARAGEEPVVAVASDVADAVPAHAWGGVRVLVDASLPQGGCEVRAAHTWVDASVSGRLGEIARALDEEDT